MSTTSSDEFSAYDLSEFTEEDLQRADAHVERIFEGGPQITIEVEVSPQAEGSLSSTIMSQTPHASESRRMGADMDALSPMQRHRKNGVLSVSDLASLAWCEVQFDYGLRQRRHMPVAVRPKSFISAQGKEIFVAKKVAVKNDLRTKQGVALHKKLEREVKPEELRVEISSKEEQWALRLVNMLASLRGIQLEGYTREFPAFGILQDEVVVGIIDEVAMSTETPQKRPTSPARSKSKKSRRSLSLSPSQHLVTEYFPNTIFANPPTSVDLDAPSALTETDIKRPSTPEPSLTNTSLPRRFLHLSDTKTRKTKSLPADRDTFPSQIQLMLYYRLLKDLTSLSPPFDFATLWKRVGVDPMKTLSTRFLVQAGLFKEKNLWNNSCLNDLANTYLEMVQKLDITGMDTKLDLVYRFLGKKSRRDSKKRNASPVVSQEERDLSKAIEASLSDARVSGEPSAQGSSTVVAVQPNSVPNADSPSDPGTLTAGLENFSHLADTSNGVDEKFASTPRHASSFSSSDTEVVAIDKHDRRPIGIKSFEYDEKMLDSHILHALSWWRGDREPEGVSLEDSGRCRSCEYANNCEWRELKALEVQKRRE